MDHPVHAGICIGVILEQIVPTPYRELGNDQRGMKAVPAVNYFKEIPALVDMFVTRQIAGDANGGLFFHRVYH